MTQSPNPKVSVIIATYNRASLLPRAVSSILNQTYTDYEIIIVDDCSSDDTQETIAGFADPRIRSFRHDQNKGLVTTRNTGISNACGEYIAFLDDDDEYVPTRLENQVALLDAFPSDVAMVYGPTITHDDDSPLGNRRRRGRHLTDDVFEDALAGDNITGSISFLARTSAVREIGGFDEDAQLYEDRFFTCRILQKYRIAFDPKVVAIVHMGHAYARSVHIIDMDRSLKTSKYYRTHIRTFRTELEQRPKVFARVLRRYATSEMRCGHVRKSISLTLDAFKLAPLNPRNIFHVTWLTMIFLFYVSPMSRFLSQARAAREVLGLQSE